MTLSTFPDLYLLRHGQTVWNLEGRMQGHMDSALTDLGQAQARQQARILAALTLPEGLRLFCSPQGRARRTAEIALAGLGRAVEDPRLREIGAGAWEGRLRSEIVRDAGLAGKLPFASFADAPGGEGLDALEARLRAFLADLRSPALLVSHGIAISMLRGIVLGLDRAAIGALDNRQGVVLHLSRGTERCHEA